MKQTNPSDNRKSSADGTSQSCSTSDKPSSWPAKKRLVVSPVDPRILDTNHQAYYALPPVPDTEDVVEFFPLWRYQELEKFELGDGSTWRHIQLYNLHNEKPRIPLETPESRYKAWIEIHGRALDALQLQFAKTKVVANVDDARRHILHLWAFLPLDLCVTHEIQKYHVDWMITVTEVEHRRRINAFLDELVTGFCSLEDYYFERRPGLFDSSDGPGHVSLFRMMDVGALQILVKRLLLQTPLMFWPAIFKRGFSDTFERSITRSSVRCSGKVDSSIIFECHGNGGVEVSKLWMRLLRENRKKGVVNYYADCPDRCEYRFRKPSAFFTTHIA